MIAHMIVERFLHCRIDCCVDDRGRVRFGAGVDRRGHHDVSVEIDGARLVDSRDRETRNLRTIIRWHAKEHFFQF